MTEVEVALELTKIVLKEDEISLKQSKTPKDFVLSVYRECLSEVRGTVARPE